MNEAVSMPINTQRGDALLSGAVSSGGLIRLSAGIPSLRCSCQIICRVIRGIVWIPLSSALRARVVLGKDAAVEVEGISFSGSQMRAC